jgi:hypothetical protein
MALVGAVFLLDRPALGDGAGGAESFEMRVAPLLADHCLGCHNPSDRKGGLDLTAATGALAGGDSGPAIVPGDVEASLVWQKLAADEMPPDSKPASPTRKLSADEKELLRRWIADGASWGAGPIDPLRYTTQRRAGHDWWSLLPIAPSAPPQVDDPAWSGPIDAFVWSRLQAVGLRPSAPADPRTLIRRLAFDLLGLPPTPDEVEAFVNDTSPRAYEEMVDRYLASPHYGERWARHWLDVVRFGESQGFERDKLRPNAWPYRDWVVSALNDDMPYDEFVRLQLAGDVLRPGDPLARIATGFLVAGPWDEVGQTQQSEAMRAVVRQDELEDLVATTCQTFLALTANCARCHDHKFDPVSQRDYYRLAAALSGVRHGDRERLVGDEGAVLAETRHLLEQPLAELRKKMAAIDEPARQRILATRLPNEKVAVAFTPPIARWDFTTGLDDRLGDLDVQLQGGAHRTEHGLLLDGIAAFASTPTLSRELKEKTLEAWVSLSRFDQGGGGVIGLQTFDGQSFDSIVYGEREPRRWLAGSNGFVRTKDVGGTDETESDGSPIHVAVTYAPDGTISVYRNGQHYGQPYTTTLHTFAANTSQAVFGLRHAPVGANKLLAGTIARAQLYDRALSADEIAASAGVANNSVSADEIIACLPAGQRAVRRQLLFEISRLETRRRLLAEGPIYAVTPQEPEVCHLLRRGDTRQAADIMTPGGVAAVAGANAEFGLSADAPEAQRRVKLAEWLTAAENPLTARVVANRLWHYHFGVGLVDTPNDFGFNGGRPTHPELLDWLAGELVRQKWSLKQLHRAIVASATYRQASPARDEALRHDAGNRLLWRKSPMRLEAEVIRDAILAVAGQLNPTMGGPGFHDFRTFTFNSQFYEVFDPEGFEFQRRSIYRTVIRSGTSPLLDAFDCPDPSTIAPKRSVTTTPLQALALLNDSFLLRMSERFADRLRDEAGDDLAAAVDRACRLAYARPAAADELAALGEFATEHGLAALARVIFNSNEFVYID